MFGMTSQMRRSAMSIPRNIAEGNGRATRKDMCRFYSDARGSVYELESDLLVAQRLEFLKPDIGEELLENANEIGRMLTGLIRYLRNSPPPPATSN